MKSPAELAARWARQWQVADTREARLLNPEVWPVSLAIGRPTPQELTHKTGDVRAHLQRWRSVGVGEVVFERMSFRGGAEPVEVPVAWRLHSAREWVMAAAEPLVQLEYGRVERLLREVDPVFHRTIVRQRGILGLPGVEDVIRVAEVALRLARGCAEGRPLRALSGLGTDSKFFERHRGLVVQFLDARFDGEVGESGLEAFLGAADEGDHWLLVSDLGAGLLPFGQMRVRASELRAVGLPGSHLLVVENERCLYQLPALTDTVVVLGAGVDLEWMGASWVGGKRVGYWGDLDTWGLMLLGRARGWQPSLAALMMTREVFDEFGGMAVVEGWPGPEGVPEGLTGVEGELYGYLRGVGRGRLEQEFIPRGVVEGVVGGWRVKGW